MGTRVYMVLSFFLINAICGILFFFYMSMQNNSSLIKELRANVRITGLPDTSLVTEARFIRHRTLSDTYSIFDFSPEAKEVFPMSFVYGKSSAYNSEKILIK